MFEHPGFPSQADITAAVHAPVAERHNHRTGKLLTSKDVAVRGFCELATVRAVQLLAGMQPTTMRYHGTYGTVTEHYFAVVASTPPDAPELIIVDPTWKQFICYGEPDAHPELPNTLIATLAECAPVLRKHSALGLLAIYEQAYPVTVSIR